jgi:hypothetical protein
MPRINNGPFYRGQTYDEQLSPVMTLGLGREYAEYSLQDGTRHTGIDQKATQDINSAQLSMRPGVHISPAVAKQIGLG